MYTARSGAVFYELPDNVEGYKNNGIKGSSVYELSGSAGEVQKA
jgi:hypothetical protein